MKRLIRRFALLCLLVTEIFNLNAQALEGVEFVDRDVSEVLYAVSMFYGKPIVADDTVRGRVTFRFAGENFEQAFDAFLKSERLFVLKSDDAWTVSRVSISEGEDGLVLLEALDVKPARLVEKISRHFGVEVSWESLGEATVSVRCNGRTAQDFLNATVRQLGKSYELECDGNTFRISKLNQLGQGRSEGVLSKLQVHGDGEKYSVDVTDTSACSVLEQLFVQAGKEYIFASELQNKIRRLCFSDKSFEETLSLVCVAGNASWVLQNGVYYLVQGNSSSGDLGKVWKNYSLENTRADEAVPLIEAVYGRVGSVKLPDGMSFMCFAKPEVHGEIQEFIKTIDVKKNLNLVTLKFITAQQFLTHLPPGFTSGQFKQTGSDNTLFFTGSQEEYQNLCTSILNIDVPVKRLSYDLLVLQFTYSNSENWESTLSAAAKALDDESNVAVVLGSVLSLKMDVLSTFGYKFASSLQWALNESRAKVFADTSLSGVSGSTIKFQDTSTYRYRDNNLDPETGEPIYSGVTREITSGLEIEVKGWVSGDGMITSSITASVSRQGIDTSASTGNPPPTSEKVVTTEVRGKSGEVIVLSGLVQDEVSYEESGVPWLSKIPVLGQLFKSHKKNQQKTEMIIYLLPHWLKDEELCEAESDAAFSVRIFEEFLGEIYE